MVQVSVFPHAVGCRVASRKAHSRVKLQRLEPDPQPHLGRPPHAHTVQIELPAGLAAVAGSFQVISFGRLKESSRICAENRSVIDADFTIETSRLKNAGPVTPSYHKGFARRVNAGSTANFVVSNQRSGPGLSIRGSPVAIRPRERKIVTRPPCQHRADIRRV